MDESLKNRTIEIFEKDQKQLDGAFDSQSPDITAPKKFKKISIVENDDGTWTQSEKEVDSNIYDDSVVGTVEKGIKNDAETLQEFCRELDNTILSFNTQINAKKQQIVTLSTEAIGRNCWPGIAYSTSTSAGTARNTLSGVTQNFGSSYTLIEDREALEIYKKMAGPDVDYSVDNPFDPTSIVGLTSAYSGFGHENIRDNGRLEITDAADTEISADDYNIGGAGDPDDDFLTDFQSSSTLGTGRNDVSTTNSDHGGPRTVGAYRAYAGVGEAPDATITDLTGSDGRSRCVAIASSISTLISEIKVLRQQRDAAVDRVGITTVKGKKMEKELQNWGSENVRSQNEQRKTSNSTVISAVKSLSNL